MRVNYHVFEPSTYNPDRCATCGNKDKAATGTGHVETEAEARRLNEEQE